MALPSKKILCPIDFSEVSEQLLLKSRDLAAGMGAELYLIHILPSTPQRTLPQFSPSPENADGKALRLTRLNAKKQLYNLIKRYIPPGIKTHVIIKQGEPAEEIMITAIAEHIDFIVVALPAPGKETSSPLATLAAHFSPMSSCRVLPMNCRTNSTPPAPDTHAQQHMDIAHPWQPSIELDADYFHQGDELVALQFRGDSRRLHFTDCR